MTEIVRRGRRNLAVLAAVVAGAAALLLAACGGDAAPDRTATAGTTPAPAASAPADATAAATAETVAVRDDGLSGAPVPAHTARSSTFDADRVDAAAGTFPSLDFPSVVRAEEATWLDDDDIVLGAVQNGEARAYPLFMMTLHHVSNDELGGEPYLVTF